jgi:hypothetical protein
MKYYVGYRDTIIDRAREVSQAVLNPDLVARQLRAPKNTPSDIKKALEQAMQLVDNTGFIKIGATGLETATS